MGFFIAPSAFVSHSIARQALLALLATRDIASAKTVINLFVPRSPIPFSEGHGGAKIPFPQTKKKELKSPNGNLSSFGCGDGI